MKKLTVTLSALSLLLCAYVIPPSPLLEKGGQGGFETNRIISLKPNITEILFALGAGDNVVGVTTWCDYPPQVKNLPKVADYININTEKIIALKPDLVIGSMENSIKQQFDVLQNADIKTLTVPFTTLNQMYSSIEKIANVIGVKDKGSLLIKKIRADLSIAPSYHRTNALILVGHHPLVAASNMTFYGDSLRVLGWKNIVDSKTIPYPTINTEFILARDPDIIIDLAMGSEKKSGLPEAIKGKVISVNMSDFRAGPRIGEAIKKLITNDQIPNSKQHTNSNTQITNP